MWMTGPCLLCVLRSLLLLHLLIYQQLKLLESQQLLPMQAVRFVMAGGTPLIAHTHSQYKTITRPPPLPLAKLVRTASWVVTVFGLCGLHMHTAIC